MSLIGKKAPEWTAKAYDKGEEVTISSKDLAGKWHVLYFYPLDFTFICPTEIRGFQELSNEFAEDGIKVIGASTDSFFSHKAWFADEKTFAQKITHPVIADTNHEVSKAFDVLKEDEGIAYRATIVVDDKGVVRSVAVNDTSAGRAPKETLRTVQALMSGGLCGADWHKGEKFVK
ncbi:MAG: peroxiredoxin [Deltaproteobacteria bacterium]|nr:peroxiredoxin [Deltaproteobacteria bacterium]